MDNYNTDPEPRCAYGHVAQEKINHMEEKLEELQDGQGEILDLLKNGYFEKVRNISQAVQNLKDQLKEEAKEEEKIERRAWQWEKGWKIAVIGGLFALLANLDRLVGLFI